MEADGPIASAGAAFAVVRQGIMTTAGSTVSKRPVTAALLVIGDEILSGRTKDKNIGYVAEYLTALPPRGVLVERLQQATQRAQLQIEQRKTENE